MTAHVPPTEIAPGDAGVRSNEQDDVGRAEDLFGAVCRGMGRRTRSDGFPSDCELVVRRAQAEYWHEQRVRAETAAAGLSADEVWALVRAIRKAAGEVTGIRLPDSRAVRLWLTPALRAELRGVEAAADRLRPMILASAHLLRRREATALARLGPGEVGAAVSHGGEKSGHSDAIVEVCEQRLRRAEWLARRAMSSEVLSDLAIDPISLINGQQAATHCRTRHADGHAANLEGGPAEIIKYGNLIANGERLAPKSDADPASGTWEDFCILANAPYCPGLDHPLVRAVLLKLWALHLWRECDPSVGRSAVVRWTLCRSGRRELAMLPLAEAEAAGVESFREAYAAALGDEADATYWVVEHMRAARGALDTLASESAGEPARSAVKGAVGSHEPGRPGEAWEPAGRRSATDASLNRRQREVLGQVEADPTRVVTIAEHQRGQGVAFATARADLLDLVARGLLVQRKAGRMFVFVSPAAAGAAHVATGASDESPPAEQRAKADQVTPTPRVRATSSNDFGYEL